MQHPPEQPPEQEIIPPGQPDNYNRWEQARAQFRNVPFLMRLPVWSLLAIPALFAALWLVFIYAAYVGFAFYSSGLIAFLGIVLCFILRISPLLLVGAFIAGHEVWEWGMIPSALFIAGSIPLVLLPWLIKKRFSAVFRAFKP